MTTPAHTPLRPSAAIWLDSEDALVAAIPYLLGFAPIESAFLVWLKGGSLVLTQRLDLPVVGDLDEWLDVVVGHAATPVSDEVVVVMVTEREDAPLLAEAIRMRLADFAIDLSDALRLDEGRWWRLTCTGDGCCPAEGTPIDPAAHDAVAAEFAVLGVAPLSSRDDLVREVAADQPGEAAAAERVAAALSARADAAEHGRLEAWRDRRIAAILKALRRRFRVGDSATSTATLAGVIGGLSDIRVRDTVLWELRDLGSDELACAHAVLAAATRIAPPGQVAAVATCAATMAWLRGDGARAGIALERALADDAAYSLALLVTSALLGGMPPSTWRAAMGDLTRRVCRTGTDAPAARARGRR